jgi:hypothetical protein
VPYVETSRERVRRLQKLALVSVTGITAVVGAAYIFWTMRLWNFLV